MNILNKQIRVLQGYDIVWSGNGDRVRMPNCLIIIAGLVEFCIAFMLRYNRARCPGPLKPTDCLAVGLPRRSVRRIRVSSPN